MPNKKVIAVVDDCPLNCEVVNVFLKKSGYNVYVFVDPEDALVAIRNQNIQPDVLVTDNVMPGIGGTELARKVRGMMPNIKIIMMSGSDQAMFNKEQSDFDDFLAKPFHPNEISAKVRSVLSQAQ